MLRTLEALERAETKGCAARGAWRARTCEVEVEEHELRLMREEVGSSNTLRVRCPSSHLPLDLALIRGVAPCFRSARK